MTDQKKKKRNTCTIIEILKSGVGCQMKASGLQKYSQGGNIYVGLTIGFPAGSVVKNPPANSDVGSIPRLGRFPGEGNGNPLQCSCLGKIPWTGEPGGLQPMGS